MHLIPPTHTFVGARFLLYSNARGLGASITIAAAIPSWPRLPPPLLLARLPLLLHITLYDTRVGAARGAGRQIQMGMGH